MGRSDQNRGLGAKFGSQSVCNRKPLSRDSGRLSVETLSRAIRGAVTPNVPGVGGWVVKYQSRILVR